MLIKLRKEHGDGRANGRIIPICLPGEGFPEFENDNVFMAGFGRRQIPHCLTDMQGPEKFQVCLTYFIMIKHILCLGFPASNRYNLFCLHF